MSDAPALAAQPRGSAVGGAAHVARARVLIVDDIETNRDLLRRRLTRLGISDIREAGDGAEALDIIRAAPLDLVLLDIMMPVMTGFDVLEAMDREGRVEGLPVIVISAMNELSSIVRAIELGAEDFIFKPFDPTLLRARVLATLEKKHLRDGRAEELARKQAELDEARHLQMALTPARNFADSLLIDVVVEPAREVGGDLVDHLRLADGRRLLALGDVSGKGAGAAMMMARSHALIRGLLGRAEAEALFDDLTLAAGALNRELSTGNPSCMFMTLVLALFDPRTGRLDYVRCGHVPPFLRRADGRLERLDGARGLPLGIDEDARFTRASVTLAPGDALLILSDGVTEAAAPDGGLYDDAGVETWLAAPRTELASLVADVRAFEAGLPAADDVAALLLVPGPEGLTL